MSYRNNQFYYPTSAGEESSLFNQGGTVPQADNPPFIYPDSTIRIADPNSKRPSGLSSRKLERGYIRSLLTEAQGIQVPIKKCRFQFNPAQLQQSVSMNASMLNFFMQDPAQLSQPLGSEVSFGFDMFFDRSMEMNNGGRSSQDTVDPTNPWATGDPSEVGVLRDISSFYSVIGQGISEDQAEFAGAQYQKALNSEFNIAEGAIEEDDLATATERLEEFTSNLSVNLGNTAFLMPLPVRVMFSSLYMVEGYVTNTTVVYTKFSSTMVPMQATMRVSMRALYIGFAKKNTFVTENIKKGIEAEKFQTATARTAKADAYKALLKEVALVRFIPARTATPSSPENSAISDLLFSAAIKSALVGYLPNAKKDGEIAELFNSDVSLSISFALTFTIYGPYNTRSDVVLATGKSPTGDQPGDVPLLRLSCVSPNITSHDDWVTNIVGNTDLTGDFTKPVVGSFISPRKGIPDLDVSKWYSWRVDGTVNVVVAGVGLAAKTNTNSTIGQGTDSGFWDTDIDTTAVVGWGPALDSQAADALPSISDENDLGVPSTGDTSTVD